MVKFACAVLCLVAVSISTTNAMTPEELTLFREFMKPVVSECGAQYGVKPSQLKAAQASRDVKGVNACFTGCIMKKLNMIDSEGMFNTEQANAVLKSQTQSSKDVTQYSNVTKMCASVNDKPVSDGVAGCERAVLALQCALDNNFDSALLQAVYF